MKNSLETAQEGFWRFYASTEASHREPQQNGLIDWEAAVSRETYQANWRIQVMDVSVDKAHKADWKSAVSACSLNEQEGGFTDPL